MASMHSLPKLASKRPKPVPLIDEAIFGPSSASQFDKIFNNFVSQERDIAEKELELSQGSLEGSTRMDSKLLGTSNSMANIPKQKKVNDNLNDLKIVLRTLSPLELKKYGVDARKMESFSDDKQKRDYVSRCLQKKLKKDVRAFMEKEQEDRNQRDKAVSEQEKRVQEILVEKDVFSWIKISCKFKGLKKKLKQRLVELVTDETAFKMVDLDFRKVRNHDVDSMDEATPEKKVHLAKYRSEPAVDKKGKFVNKKTSTNSLIKKRNYLVKIGRNPDRDQEMKFEEDEDGQYNPYKAGRTTGEEGNKKVTWDARKEKKYVKEKKKAQGIKVKGIKGAHYIDISMKQEYLAVKHGSKRSNLRDYLLQRFMEGKWISNQELKYLTYSSEDANKHLDRKFYKKAIGSISPDVKAEVEMMIAEDILDDYYSIKDQLLEARRLYLKEQSSGSRKESIKFLDRVEEENQKIARQMDFSRWLKVAVPQARKRVQTIERRQCLHKSKSSGAFRKSKNVNQASSKKNRIRNPKNFEEEKIKQSQDFFRRNTSKYINTFALGRVDKKNIYHLHHPTSAIYKLPSYKRNKKGHAENEEVIKKLDEMERMKVTIKAVQDSDIREQNLKFLTGGPSTIKRSTKMSTKVAATLIQKVARGYLIRKQFLLLQHSSKNKSRKLNNGEGGLNRQNTRLDNSQGPKLRFIDPRNQNKFRMKEGDKQDRLMYEEFLVNLKKNRELVARQVLDRKQKREELLLKQNQQRLYEVASSDIKQQNKPSVKRRRRFIKRRGNNLEIKQSQLLSICKENLVNRLQKTMTQYTAHEVNAQDEQGNTPLYYACKNASVKIVYFLLSKKALPNNSCNRGNTPLHMAFRSKKNRSNKTLRAQAAIISQLVWSGGNLNALNNENLTPLAYGSHKLIKMLNLNYGIAIGDDFHKNQAIPPQKDNNFLYGVGEVNTGYEPEMAKPKYKRLERASTRSSSQFLEMYFPPGEMDIFEKRYHLGIAKIEEPSEDLGF